jgi:hypothetical protein
MSPGSAIDRGGGGVRTTGEATGVREGCGGATKANDGGTGEGGAGGGTDGGGVRDAGSATDAAKETGVDRRGSPGGGGGVAQARPISASEDGGTGGGGGTERGVSPGGGGGVLSGGGLSGVREVEGGGSVLSGVREVEGGGGVVDSGPRCVAGVGGGGIVLRVTGGGVRDGWPEGGRSENERRDEPRPVAGGLGPPGGGALALVTSRPYPKMQRSTTSYHQTKGPPVTPLQTRSREPTFTWVTPAAEPTDRFGNP